MRSDMIRQLDEVVGNTRGHQYGRVPRQPIHKSSNLPRNMIFCREDTGDVFPLDSNGATQFLSKCGLPTSQDNVDWVLDAVLNTPLSDAVNLNGVPVGVSCEVDRDPRGRSLSELGITKSMVQRKVMRPPTMSNRPPNMNLTPPSYGGAGMRGMDNRLTKTVFGVPVDDSVDFGKPTLEVFKNRVVKAQKDREQKILNMEGR